MSKPKQRRGSGDRVFTPMEIGAVIGMLATLVGVAVAIGLLLLLNVLRFV